MTEEERKEYTEWHKENVIEPAMVLIRQKLENPDNIAASCLFYDEFGASDWTVEEAVERLFTYATAYGWGE